MNAPDAWEQTVLKQFEAEKAAGADVKTMERHETVSENGKTMFRYIRGAFTIKKPLD